MSDDDFCNHIAKVFDAYTRATMADIQDVLVSPAYIIINNHLSKSKKKKSTWIQPYLNKWGTLNNISQELFFDNYLKMLPE